MPSYYDIDAILAEEELVPCTTLFDFAHLAHFDPDYLHHSTTSFAPEDKRRKKDNKKKTTYLPEGSRIKMPLWAIDKWAMLGFVRLGLPRHFGRRARERLEADPGSADLRSKNDRFFLSGILLVDLIERCSSVVAAAAESRRGTTSNRRTAHAAAMAEVSREAKQLRRTLLLTYTGERLRRSFDYTLSSIDDDVTSYTKRLTCLELRLFRRGASAAAAHAAWKHHGSRRIQVSEMALRSAAMQKSYDLIHHEQQQRSRSRRAVTPEEERGGGRSKRVRAY